MEFSLPSFLSMQIRIALTGILSVFLCSQGGQAQNSTNPAEPPDGMADLNPGSDGIIGLGEVLDSPLLQTHMNPGRDPSIDVLSTYFLRDHITAQVEAFKYLGSEQECFLPWELGSTQHSQVVDYLTKVVRYNIEKRRVPRYRYNYKYVTKTVYVRERGASTSPRPSGSSSYPDVKRTSPGKLVKKQVRVRALRSVRQVGTKLVKVAVPHPEGKYEKEVRVAVTKMTGLAHFQHGWYAANAQLVFSMIKAGLPATDPQIALTVQSINNLLYAYGIPDTTDDVAWLTALYANLPQDDPAVKAWTERLVSRLISSSAQLGENAGMWGPVCVNPKYVNELIGCDEKFVEKYIAPLKRSIASEARASVKSRLERRLREKESLYWKWQKAYQTWAMSGHSAIAPRGKTVIPAESTGQKEFFYNYSLQIPGQLQDPYHFQFTDLESTCSALFALREVQAAGVMPETLLVPADTRGRALASPVDIQDQLAACYSALRRLRNKNGGWNSCYSVQYHHVCRDVPYSSVLPKNVYKDISQEDHWAYDVMGLASMEYLASLFGGGRAQKIRGEIQACQEMTMTNLQSLADLSDLRQTPGRDNVFYYLADLTDSSSKEAHFLWRHIGALALRESGDIASFEVQKDYASHAARQSLRAEEHFFSSNSDGKALPRVDVANPQLRADMAIHRIGSLCKRASLTYFLSKGIRQPVFAAVKPAGNKTTLPALDYFVTSKKHRGLLKYFHVDSMEDIAYYNTSLFLVVEVGEGLVLEEEEENSLLEYMQSFQGMVVFLGVAGEDTEAFQGQLSIWFSRARVPVEKKAVDFRGSPCFEYVSGGRPLCLLVDASADQSPREAYSNRLKVYKSLVDEKLPEGYLKPDYGLLPGKTSHGELRLTGIEWESPEGNANP